ncbi:MAG: FMN-binding protein [Phycisphaerae bacterium]|nr:FMN-binding protein [Phycisphaerae bacterium]
MTQDRHYIRQAWLVLVLCGVFGAALAGVHAGLSAKIADNKRDDTMNQIPRLVPGAVRGVEQVVGETVIYRAVDESGKLVGWVLPGMGQGFADIIELLVGLDAQGETITGMSVLAQKETPGLGDKITKEAWRAQFAGKPAGDPLSVTKAATAGRTEIAAISGATISSQSVTDIVNKTVADFRQKLASGAVKE